MLAAVHAEMCEGDKALMLLQGTRLSNSPHSFRESASRIMATAIKTRLSEPRTDELVSGVIRTRQKAKGTPLYPYAPSAAGYNGVPFAFCLVLITPLTSSSVLGSLSRVLIAVAMILDADSRKLCGELESLVPCSSVLAALGTIQLQGPQISKSPRSFLESASNLYVGLFITAPFHVYCFSPPRMMAIAPNLTTMVGELVGARLIAHAGSLLNLAKHPSSTVQILGAEKALFRSVGSGVCVSVCV